MNDYCISCDFIRFLFTAHPLNGPFSETTRVSRYQKDKTNLDFTEARQWVAVASAGPYASLHLAPYRQPRQHPTPQFLQAGCPSCVKAQKAFLFTALQYYLAIQQERRKSVQ